MTQKLDIPAEVLTTYLDGSAVPSREFVVDLGKMLEVDEEIVNATVQKFALTAGDYPFADEPEQPPTFEQQIAAAAGLNVEMVVRGYGALAKALVRELHRRSLRPSSAIPLVGQGIGAALRERKQGADSTDTYRRYVETRTMEEVYWEIAKRLGPTAEEEHVKHRYGRIQEENHKLGGPNTPARVARVLSSSIPWVLAIGDRHRELFPDETEARLPWEPKPKTVRRTTKTSTRSGANRTAGSGTPAAAKTAATKDRPRL